MEMKFILAMFLARYKFDLVDENGKFLDPLPVPDRDNKHQVRTIVDEMLCQVLIPSFLPPPSRLVPLGLRSTSNLRGLCGRQVYCNDTNPDLVEEMQVDINSQRLSPVHPSLPERNGWLSEFTVQGTLLCF